MWPLYWRKEMAKEIERKWLINGLPKGYRILNKGYARTWYLSVEPERRLRIYVDAAGVVYRHYTKKIGTGLSRDEFERNISVDDFNRLYEECGNLKDNPIYSEWYDLEFGELLIQIQHKDANKEDGLWFMEIEFSSEEEARAFVLPENIQGVDVTFDESYKMRNYWKRTRLGQEETV